VITNELYLIRMIPNYYTGSGLPVLGLVKIYHMGIIFTH